MELSGKRKQGRSKSRFLDALREEIAVVEVTEKDAENRTALRWKIRCSDPRREKMENRRILNRCLLFRCGNQSMLVDISN